MKRLIFIHGQVKKNCTSKRSPIFRFKTTKRIWEKGMLAQTQVSRRYLQNRRMNYQQIHQKMDKNLLSLFFQHFFFSLLTSHLPLLSPLLPSFFLLTLLFFLWIHLIKFNRIVSLAAKNKSLKHFQLQAGINSCWGPCTQTNLSEKLKRHKILV